MMKKLIVMASCMVALAAQAAVTTTWNNTVGDWTDADKWSHGVPGNGDTAVIGGGTVTLAEATEPLAALTMTGGTLLFTNWTTKLTATSVSINGGSVTHADNDDMNGLDGWDLLARVWIACSNLTITAPGTINVVGKGYPGATNKLTVAYGPGGASQYFAGGSHAGYGGNSSSALYGSETTPTNPGSGGWTTENGAVSADGGGVVRIDADGTVTVNGTLSAAGENGSSWHGGGASGGSIWITCKTITGSGTVQASGGNGANVAAGGGGGRIAVDYDPVAQAAAGVPGVTFSVSGGTGTTRPSGDLGTLYFTDNQFLKGNVVYKGQRLSPAASGTWALDSLVISNGWLRFPASGGRLTVTNNVLLTGAGAGLDLGGNATRTVRSFFGAEPANHLYSTPFAHSMQVGGDLILTNGASLRLYSAATNGIADCGLLVSVTGNMTIASGSTAVLVSHWTNGGSARLEMKDFLLASGGAVTANQNGFGAGIVDTHAGYGPGSAKSITGVGAGGAGYGGRGGKGMQNAGGPAYGSSHAPSFPGSGGDPCGADSKRGNGGNGGGLVRLIARGQATVNGSITANGQSGFAYYGGGGSGGGIWITCKDFQGSGVMQANGGDRHVVSGSGGGGRIAVWYDVPESRWSEIEQGSMDGVAVTTNLAAYTGSIAVNPGISGSYTPQPAAGTIVFLTVPPPRGTVMVLR